MQTHVHPLKTDTHYRLAIAEIETYFRNEPAEGSPEAARFNALATQIEAYEAEHWPMSLPTR